MKHFYLACSNLLDGNLEKTASTTQFSELIKEAAVSAAALKGAGDFMRKAAPSFAGTGAALAGGGLVANKVVNNKVNESKEKAKKYAAGAVSALGAAAAMYASHKASQSGDLKKKPTVNSFIAKTAEQDLIDLASCFFLDEVLVKSAEPVLKVYNDEMLETIASNILEKFAGLPPKKEDEGPDFDSQEGTVSEASSSEEAPTEEVPTEEVPTEDVPAEEVPAEEVPAEEVPAEESPTEESPMVGEAEPAPESTNPVGLAATMQHSMDRLTSGTAVSETAVNITAEQEKLKGYTKAIQNSAIAGNVPSPQISAAALLSQNKINSLQNYMNFLQSQGQTEQPPMEPDVLNAAAPDGALGPVGNVGNVGPAGASEVPSVLSPAEEVPAEEVPAEEVPAKEVPAEEVPAEEVPAEEVPAEEVPAEEVPSEEVPAEESPAEEPTDKNNPKPKLPKK